MSNIFDFVRPARWRRRRRMEDNELLAALGRMAEGDAGCKALIEVVVDQFEQEMTSLLSAELGQTKMRGETGNPSTGSGRGGVNLTVAGMGGKVNLVDYQRGRAAALYYLLDRIEAARSEAREIRIAEMKRREQEQQGE